MTNNVTLPQSLLERRHNSICYHRVYEAQAVEVIVVGWIQSKYNQAHLGTSITLSKKRRYDLLNEIMWNNGFMILN